MSDPIQTEAFQQAALLFLAGEMPMAERAAFSRRLQTDAAAGRAFAEIEAAWVGAHSVIDEADRQEPLFASADAGSRWFGRQVAQWHVDRTVAAGRAPVERSVGRLPVWTWPLAAAAVVVLGLGIWTLLPDTASAPVTPVVATAETGPDVVNQTLIRMVTVVDPALALADLESRADTLHALSDDAAGAGQ